MTITLEMILTRFFEEHPESEIEYPKPKRPLLGIHLLPSHTELLSENYLYVSDRREAAFQDGISSSVSIICFTTETETISYSSNIILLHSDLELAEGFKCLLQCYTEFA